MPKNYLHQCFRLQACAYVAMLVTGAILSSLQGCSKDTARASIQVQPAIHVAEASPPAMGQLVQNQNREQSDADKLKQARVALWKKFDALVRQRTPKNALDCGNALLDDTETQRIAVDACAVDAFEKGRPFLARFYEGTRQRVSLKLVLIGTSRKAAHFLWIRGGSGNELPEFGNELCKRLEIVSVRGHRRIGCRTWRKQ